MAAIQQSPITLHAKSPPSNRSTVSSSLRSFSTTPRLRLPSLKLSTTTTTSLRRLRSRRGGATMMDPAASSYANALADVAKSNNTLEATVLDLEKVEKIFSDPQVPAFFANPTVEIERKQKLIDEMAKTSGLQAHVANFLNIIVDMRRVDLVKEIVKEFEMSYNKMTGTEIAVVSSVVKLESQHLAQIAQAVQKLTGAKNVRIKTVIDKSLVAGFTIRYGSSGSKLIDMSVKKQLDEIASQLDFSTMVGSFAT